MRILGEKLILKNSSCERATLSREMSHDFNNVKNASHSLKCQTLFKENIETFSRVYGGNFNQYIG